ncbi:alcohol dehydrogenase catalytic domain-containing protein [Rugosimonospora acidiphila]|uniref:alcohol dehydrogenase catalytic domain-containing protein n=1 Tax=Rugosimonospora acidiphila TaxID=556531 RepID=UPI0031F1808B
MPEPGPGEVLVKITACGICYTDLDLLQGHWPIASFPVVPGHEITGVVAATGPAVSWPQVGARVGAQFLGDSCRHCDYCVRGDQILCANVILNATPSTSAAAATLTGLAPDGTLVLVGYDPDR